MSSSEQPGDGGPAGTGHQNHHQNQHIETEVKIFVTDLDAIARRLEEAGAVLSAPRVHEYNVRYEDADETLGRQAIVLRLRRDTRVRLTYKSPPVGAQPQGVRSRFEAEVTVDDFDTMDLILQRLGFHAYAVYEKYRTTYELDGAEIVLDEMPYGNFVEIEGTTRQIEQTLTRLDLRGAPRITASYMMLFEAVRRALKLDIHDLTFANFRDVDVPPETFFGGSGTGPLQRLTGE